MAQTFASFSKDPSTQVGCLAIGEYNQVLAQGYNGFPREIQDLETRLNNREIKYKHTIHAETNLLTNANLTGINLADSSVYVYGLFPCINCSLILIQLGIREIIFQPGPSLNLDQWAADWAFSQSLFREAGIIVEV